MSVNLSPIGGAAAQFFDNNGNPLAGGKLYTYAAGTTTPLATYTTSVGNIPHTNPIILDSAGRVPGGQIWLTDGSVDYKFLLETSFSVLVGTFDNIPPAISGSAADIVYLPAGTGAVATTLQAKEREEISVLDFGAIADYNATTGAGTDNSPAFQLAINYAKASGKNEVFAPAGRYLLNTSLNVSNIFAGFVIRGEAGWQISGALVGTVLYGNTGDVPIVDFIGTQHGVLSSLALVSANAKSTPSTVGVYFSRSVTSQYAQFCRIENCSINLQTNPAANGGRGSVALFNYAAEIFVIRDSYLLADTGCGFASTNYWNVISAYQTRGGPSSCSDFFIEGNCTFHSFDAIGAPFVTYGAQVIKGQFYVNGSGQAGSHGFRLLGINTGHNISVFVEGAVRLGRISNGLGGSTITTFSSTGVDKYIDTDGTFTGITNCKFNILASGGGGAVAPAYLISGAATDVFRNVHISSWVAPTIRAIVPTNQTFNLFNCSWEYSNTSKFTRQTLATRLGTWSENPLQLGTAHLWVDATNNIRLKIGAPSSDTDAASSTLAAAREVTYTATATGFDTVLTGTAWAVKTGSVVTLELPSISGTSNATTFTMTGMPVELRPTATRVILVRVQNNTGGYILASAFISTLGTVSLYTGLNGGAFTASGTKSHAPTLASYII